MTRLVVDGVTKRYGSVEALDDVSLSVRPGEFHCLVGPNGSGKTTLLRVILGLTRQSSGSVSIPDVAIGCGFQRANFYRDLTVAENLSVFAAMVDADREWREHLVASLGLERVLDRRAGDLSGGYGKKLDLALAMLDQPAFLFLDEPMGDLDDVSKERLCSFLSSYRDAGNAVVVSTHHLADFESLVDRLTILHDGRVILDALRGDIDMGDHDSLQDLYVDRVLALDDGTAADVTGTDDTGR